MTLVTQAVLSSFVAAALAAGQARAQEPKLSDLKAELDAVKKQVDEIKGVQKQIADVILGRGEGIRPEDASLLKRLDTLSEAVRKLDDKVTTIGDRFAPMPRVVGSSPIAGAITPKGTVRLVNDYHRDVSIVVNGVSHVIAPSQSREVPVAPGEFGYALPQSGGLETRSRIRDGETVTLRIR